MIENDIYENGTTDGEENEPMTLDEAFAQAQARIEAEDGNGESQTETVETETVETAPDAEAVETATTTVPETTGNTDGEVARLREALDAQSRENEQYRQQMAEMREAIRMLQSEKAEQSKADAEAVVEAIMTPPQLDLSSIMYAEEDEQKAAMSKWQSDTAAYLESNIMKKLQPVIAEYEAREAEAKRMSAKNAFRQNGEYADFGDREAWIEQLLENNPELRSLPLEKQYQIGYLITQGVDAVKAKKAPAPAPKTIDERLAEIEGDPELMRALEARRVRATAQKSADTPPGYVAGGGSSRVGLNVPDEPADFDASRKQALARFFGRK